MTRKLQPPTLLNAQSQHPNKLPPHFPRAFTAITALPTIDNADLPGRSFPHGHLRGAGRNLLLQRVFRADRGRRRGRMAPGQPVLRRRLRRFDRRHRQALPHHRRADRRLAGPPRPCHPAVVTRAGVRPGPRRPSGPHRPAARRRRGAAATARTRRSAPSSAIPAELVVPRRRATAHGAARGRPAGQAGARPAVGQHRVRARRRVAGTALGAARLARPDRRDHQLAAGHRRAGRIRRDHRPIWASGVRSCCLFYRIPGRSVCGDCVFRPDAGVPGEPRCASALRTQANHH